MQPIPEDGPVSKVNRSGSESTQILVNHWRWLQAQGPSYKRQAASCKRQAASLTRLHYNDIVSYKLKENKQ
jgi:hypothetical protein